MFQNGADLSYQPISEVQLPEKAVFSEWLAPGLAAVRGKGFFKSDKFSVFSFVRGLLAPIEYSEVSVTPTGFIALRKKKHVTLIKADGTVVSGDDCDGAEDLGEGLIAKKIKKSSAIFRAETGEQLTDYIYSEITPYREGCCAVKGKEGMQLLDTDGKPLFNEYYDFVSPFVNGFARVGGKKQINYIDREGNIIYTGPRRGARDFSNGYAVVSDGKGKYGAIDTSGLVVIEPAYRFVKDCAHDMFVVSNTGTESSDGKTFQGKEYGLIDVHGKVILPLSYDRIELRPDGNGYNYGHIATWQRTSGNTVTNYAVFVSGLVDVRGNIVLPDKFVAIGDLSEGLRAFKSFSDSDVLTFGYMNEKGETVIKIAEVPYKHVYDSERVLLREDLTRQMRPFKDGCASLCIRGVTQTFGIFSEKTTQLVATKVNWYSIDREGNQVDTSANRNKDVFFCKELPFYNEYVKLEPMIKDVIRDTMHMFCDMYEVNFGPGGFAILDSDLNIICSHYDGKPFTTAGQPHHKPYAGLAKAAENVWIVNDGESTEVVFSEFESPSVFSSGLAPVRDKSGKFGSVWGYMDIKGNMVVSPKYSYASGFEGGYAVARIGSATYLLRRDVTVIPRS